MLVAPLHPMYARTVWKSLLDLISCIWYTSSPAAYHRTKEEIEEEYEVIKKCQKNPEHFAPLYRKYYDSIFIFIYKRVDHLEVTADITSRVFLKCLKHISKYKYQGVPFSAWLYRIAINEVNLFYRQQTRFERTVSIDQQHIQHLCEEMEYDQVAIDPEVLISVLLEQLNSEDVQFIELRFFENRSFKEMGYLLGLTEVNAKIKTYRILKKLKKISEQINYNN